MQAAKSKERCSGETAKELGKEIEKQQHGCKKKRVSKKNSQREWSFRGFEGGEKMPGP